MHPNMIYLLIIITYYAELCRIVICYGKYICYVTHVSKWILWGAPGWPKEFWQRKGLSVRNPTLSLAFTVKISSQKIYINVRMMSEIIVVVRVSCMVRQTPVICLPPPPPPPRIHSDKWIILAWSLRLTKTACVSCHLTYHILYPTHYPRFTKTNLKENMSYFTFCTSLFHHCKAINQF